MRIKVVGKLHLQGTSKKSKRQITRDLPTYGKLKGKR